MVGQGGDALFCIGHCLTAMLQHLHSGADAYCHHEGNDKNWNGAP
jgi:hypothetical protein